MQLVGHKQDLTGRNQNLGIRDPNNQGTARKTPTVFSVGLDFHELGSRPFSVVEDFEIATESVSLASRSSGKNC